MRLCGSDLAAGGICFAPVSLSTLECPKADAHRLETPILVVVPEPAEESEPVAV